MEALLHSKGCVAFAHGINGPRQLVGQAGEGLALAMSILHPSQVLLPHGMMAQAPDSSLGKSPCSATPARLALSAICLPIAGKLYWLLVLWTVAKSAARVRVRWRRRRRRARVARIGAGETEAGGSRPPRSKAEAVSSRSPVRKNRTPGSVRGALGNWHLYRDDVEGILETCKVL
jgi:hypothetical protein